MITQASKNDTRQKVHVRIRRKVQGTAERPRLSVYRSLNQIYVQLIDDLHGRDAGLGQIRRKKVRERRPAAIWLRRRRSGNRLPSGPRPKASRQVVFDRGGYQYHGRVKALADAAREARIEVLRGIERPMATVRRKLDAGEYQLKDQVVAINRVTKVVKGGKNLSFAALVVVGDPASAVVGYGSGKAKEVPQAIRKGIEAAKKNLVQGQPDPDHDSAYGLGRYGSGMVLLKPAPEGNGRNRRRRGPCGHDSAGVQNVLTKSIGTTNPHNVIKATFDALKSARPAGSRGYARQNRGGALSMPATDKKIRLHWVRSAICYAREAPVGSQGPGIYPAEPSDRAGRYPLHPRHGEEGAAPGQNPEWIGRPPVAGLA